MGRGAGRGPAASPRRPLRAAPSGAPACSTPASPASRRGWIRPLGPRGRGPLADLASASSLPTPVLLPCRLGLSGRAAPGPGSYPSLGTPGATIGHQVARPSWAKPSHAPLERGLGACLAAPSAPPPRKVFSARVAPAASPAGPCACRGCAVWESGDGGLRARWSDTFLSFPPALRALTRQLEAERAAAFPRPAPSGLRGECCNCRTGWRGHCASGPGCRPPGRTLGAGSRGMSRALGSFEEARGGARDGRWPAAARGFGIHERIW